MTRRRRRLLLAGLLAVLAALSFLRLPVWSRGLAARGLTAFFHRPSTVGAVRYHVFPLEIEVLDVRVGGITPTAEPFLEVPRVVVVPALAPLWERRIVLSRMRVERPVIHIHAFPQGGDDIPKMGGGTGRKREVRIRRLVIEDGVFALNHERVPLHFDVPDFEARLFSRRAGVLAGRLAFAPGELTFGVAPTLPIGAELDLALDGPRVQIESARLHAENTDLAGSGFLRFGAPIRGEFQLQGPVDLDVLERHVMRTGLGIKGHARYEGGLTVEGPRLRLKGRLTGTAGEYDAVPVPRFAAAISWDERGVILRGLQVEALGGQGTLDVEVPPGKGTTARLQAELRGADAEGLVMAIFDIGAVGFDAAATGKVAIEWPKGRIRDLSGSFGVELAPGGDGRTPVSGRFDWRATRGVQTIVGADLRSPKTHARLQGRIERDDRTDIAVEGESTDLSATDDLGLRIRRALGTFDAAAAGFTGRGSFRGTWRGTLSVPVFDGRFSGQDVGYLDVVWGEAEWAGVADPFAVESRALVVRRPGAEIALEGRMETGFLGEKDGVDVRVRFQGWPAEDFIRAFQWDLQASGRVSGEAVVKGRRSLPEGNARVTASSGRYYGVPIADLDTAMRLRGAVTEVSAGRVRVGGGTVTFRGTATDDGIYDGALEAEGVEVGELAPPLGPDLRWGGRVSGRVTLAGTLARPRLVAAITSPRLFLGEEGVGALEARLLGSGDGTLRVEGRCRSPRVDLAVAGSVGAASPYVASLQVQARETSFDPFLRLLAPSLPPAAGIVATGTMSLEGALLSPRELHARAEVPSLQVLLPEYPVRNREPVRVSFEQGRLRVEGLHLSGEGTDLAVGGEAVLVGEGTLDLSAKGNADLRALGVLARRLRGRGAARLAMTVSGTRSVPRLEGTLELEGAGVRVRGFPHGLEDVRGRVSFTGRSAHLDGVTATIGGGTVELEGQAAYAPGRLTSFDVRATGRNIGLRYPEGLHSLVDADLRFFGDASQQWIGGSVDVRQALWTRRYDVANELLAESQRFEESASLGGGVRYDIKVRAPGTLRVDNNLATLQARADLALQGTYDSPVLIGRAEVDRGRVYFQGNTYVIRRGTIDFTNPQRIDPLFDIEAETRIRSYRVTLKMNGTLERVYPTLTSDPPLSAVQILSLLAGADESRVASLAQAQTEQAKLAATGAATLAAGKISEDIGLERGAERLGLSRFSIDPNVFHGNLTNPTARLTVGKRLTSDLNVVVSVDLRGTQERLLSVEYNLSDRLSVLLTQAELGGYGFDLRLRQTH